MVRADSPRTVGGAVESILFNASPDLSGVYLSHAGTAGAFGAADPLAVLTILLSSVPQRFVGTEVTEPLGGKRLGATFGPARQKLVNSWPMDRTFAWRGKTRSVRAAECLGTAFARDGMSPAD
jgi:hypothetical protein